MLIIPSSEERASCVCGVDEPAHFLIETKGCGANDATCVRHRQIVETVACRDLILKVQLLSRERQVRYSVFTTGAYGSAADRFGCF